MAEENEKKPEFVVHKKEQEPASVKKPAASGASAEKKRVIVVKKKAPQAAAPAKASGDSQKKVVVKSAAKVDQAKTEAKADAAKKAEPKKQTFELNPSRPNVKAGNLSDKGKQNARGLNQGRGGANGKPFNREGGGFSGAQARQSYQNRERDNSGKPGANRQGGFQKKGDFQPRQGGCFQNRQGGAGGQFRVPRGGMGGGAAPLPIDNSRSPGKKAAYKGKKQIYNRKDEEQYDDKFFEQKKKVETPASVVPKSIDIMESISVSDLARKMNLKASEVIAKLMGMGMMVTITQTIDSDTATLLAAEYGCEVHLVSLYDETVIES